MKRIRTVLAIGIVAAIFGAGGWVLFRQLQGSTPVLLSHGRFDRLNVFVPKGTPTSFVLLLSDEAGWDRASVDLADLMVRDGAMVVGIDLPKLEANLDADDGDCVFPDGDLENLSRFVQAYYRLPVYRPPILVGDGEGAAFAYAMIAQAPAGTFAGAVGLNFRTSLAMRKPLCRGAGVESRPRAGGGVDLLPATALHGVWITVPSGRPAPEGRDAVLRGALARIRASLPAPAAPPPGSLGALPLTVMPAPVGGSSDAFAIVLSGDGGWAGLDRDVGAALVAAGIPVVGLDSLRYFWGARTPRGLAGDLDRTIRYYTAHFARKRVLLVGYSQGADVLPFAVNRLPADTRAEVALVAMLGLSEHALFEFHLANWLSDDDSGLPTVPEVARLGPMPALCIYGEDEDDSACPRLDPAKVHVVKMPGGHHFGGDYTDLARRILQQARP